jgi:thiamine pyrophosphate-dependent acetolactate synthase large subunit-like protein
MVQGVKLPQVIGESFESLKFLTIQQLKIRRRWKVAKAQSRVEKKQPEYGSDVIVDLMKAFDIEYAAFNPGATFRGIHDSIVNYGGNYKPEVIFCFHEEISVALAHGYAKAKGKPMAAIVHNIVGLQHASMAIFNAWCDRVPVMVLGATGPMNTTRRRPRIDWIHTALVQGNQVRDYVKWDDQPYNLASVPESFIRGYRIATTEPMAPVYINYDADIQEDAATTSIEIPDISRFAPPAPVQANPEALRRAAELLVKAKSPLIIADYLGRNPKTVPALIELAELLAIPVVDKGNRFNFPNTHPLDEQTRACEYLVDPAAKIIHISMNDMLVRSWAGDYMVLQALDIPMSADTSVAVPELVRLCRELMGSDGKGKTAIEARLKELGDKHKSRRAVNGTSNGWARKLWNWTEPNQYLGASGGAGVGYGMSAAIGAALALKDSGKLCVDIQADGDLLMTSSSLWTAAKHKIPLLIVMHNNQSFYNSEEHGIEVAKFRRRPVENAGIGTHVDDPKVHFAKMAESFGVHAEGPIEKPADVGLAIERALKYVKEKKLPALVDVVAEPR